MDHLNSYGRCPEIARAGGGCHQIGAERRQRLPLGPEFGPYSASGPVARFLHLRLSGVRVDREDTRTVLRPE